MQSVISASRGAGVPWWAKVTIKLILARLPIAYALWRRLGIFRHGHMADLDYAHGVLRQHLARAGLENLRSKTALELGPGDSVLSGLLAAGYGAEQTFLVDVGTFAEKNAGTYRDAASALAATGLAVPDLSATTEFEDVLKATSTVYLTEGVASLRTIPTESVYFVWSQAVLEHVRRRDFAACMAELHRVLTPGGVASHTVDLKDHLGASLNNLRFPDRLWEKDFVAGAGFYTNRISFEEMLQLMRQAGFETTVTDVRRWDRLPLARNRMSRQFRDRAEGELLVEGFDVLLRKA